MAQEEQRRAREEAEARRRAKELEERNKALIAEQEEKRKALEKEEERKRKQAEREAKERDRLKKKKRGENDDHILEQVKKRFNKLRALQEEVEFLKDTVAQLQKEKEQSHNDKQTALLLAKENQLLKEQLQALQLQQGQQNEKHMDQLEEKRLHHNKQMQDLSQRFVI